MRRSKKTEMSQSAQNRNPWSLWHERLHKTLLAKADLIPDGASILVAVSGGQDSMALLKLIIDLQRLHHWQIQVWHGNHGWHEKSKEFANGVKNWCRTNKIEFFEDLTNKQTTKSEESARLWRYEKLSQTAKKLSLLNQSSPCKYILTGHTASDKAETLLMNIARGTNLAGLASLPDSRELEKDLHLVRPLINFSRDETKLFCDQMKLPIWLDPTNTNNNLTRNKIRQEILPVLNDLYKGSDLRIATLSSNLSTFKSDQEELANFALSKLTRDENKSLYRRDWTKLSISARRILLAQWFKKKGVPSVSAKELTDLCQKLDRGKPPGSKNLAKKWQITWTREIIHLSCI